MRSVLKKLAVLSVIVTAFAIVTANAQTARSAATMEQQIKKKILALPYYGVFDHISFKVEGSMVTLFGKVASLGTRSDAANVVKRIPGVESVVNNIKNLPPSSFDDRIRRQLFATIANSPGLGGYLQEPSPSVRIIVENGRVALEGYVDNQGTANVMYILARTVPGTFEVQNHLIVGRLR